MSEMTQNTPSHSIVITGGTSGIGLTIAKVLLGNPIYKVILVGRDPDHIRDAKAELGAVKTFQDRYSFYECDLADSKAISELSHKITATHRDLYALVNNAGTYPFGGLETTDEAAWDHTFQVNLKAAFLLTKQLTPAISRNNQGGRIINISSTAGILPNHFALAYSVSKAALIHLTKTLAKELGRDSITVNC
ncbi:MAG: SDR family oxidoreductase, partial [Proteobacteria bacterium]